MRARRAPALFIVLALIMCACSRTPALEPGAELLSESGDVLLYTEDHEYAALYEKLYAESYGGKAAEGKELFITLAETAIMARLAELYGAAADKDSVRADYELLLTDASAKDAAFLKELKKASALEGEAFDDMYIKHAYLTESATLLAKDIAAEYVNLPDGEAIREAVLNNIIEMVSQLSVSVGYPGLEKHTFTFGIIDSL